jgi:hypothetical protein
MEAFIEGDEEEEEETDEEARGSRQGVGVFGVGGGTGVCAG